MPPTINDMPVHIFERICLKLGDDYREKYRFVLRNVCKSFRRLVDSWTPKFKNISIDSDYQRITVEFDDTKCRYDHFLMPLSNRKHHDLAVDDLISVLNFPIFQFEELKIGRKSIIDKRFLEKFLLKLELLNLKIHVSTVSINYSGREIEILKFCENPEILKIDNSRKAPIQEIEGSQVWISEFIKEINCMDLFQQTGYYRFSKTKPKSTNFSRMELKCRSLYMRKATIIIKNFLKSSNLESCYLETELLSRIQLEKNIQRFGAKVQPYNEDIFHYPIPNSHDFFEIEIQWDGIRIERKSISA
ncbi:unnamed protein product [Caenorhabditis nigoni]